MLPSGGRLASGFGPGHERKNGPRQICIDRIWWLQSFGEAHKRWGEHGATALWDACTAKLVFGGLSSARDVYAISKLRPEVDEPTVSTSRGRDGHWSVSTSTQRRAAMTPAQLREPERWHALLLYPAIRPVLTEQRPWWREPRYEELISRAGQAIRERVPMLEPAASTACG